MTDRRLELIIGTLLRVGVALAAAVVLGGGIWYLAARGMATADYRHFHRVARGFGSLAGLSAPEAAIQAGLLILIATPVARVIFSLVGFLLERDRMYVAITLAVLAVLAYSIGSAWL
jgi:uncharacterized membrane protein